MMTRLDVITHLTNEHGRPLVILDWWREGLAALDDGATHEILLWLQRQTGKSQFGAAVEISELLTRPGSYTVGISASADQAEAVYHRKIRKPLERLARDLGLASMLRFTQRGVENLENGAMLEVLATTDDTTPGRTVTLLVIDEARHVPDEVYAALVPSVIGAGGKTIIASTAGPPRGFFWALTQNPTDATWLYHADGNENPEANRGVIDFIRRRLGLVSPAAAQRELGNQFTDDGDELIAWPLIEAAIDDTLGELPSSPHEAWAAADLARRRDIASIVTVDRVAARRPEATDHLRVISIATWDPKQSPTGEVDFAALRAAVGDLPRRFPRLRKFYVDEGAEGGSVLPFAKSHSALAVLTDGFVASAASNMGIWSALAARLNAGTISIPRHERLIGELRSLRRESFMFGSKWRVVDSSRKFHRDVSFSLALATWAAGTTVRCDLCDTEDCSGFHILGPELFEQARQRRVRRAIDGVRPAWDALADRMRAGDRDGVQAIGDTLVSAVEAIGDPAVRAAVDAHYEGLGQQLEEDINAAAR